MENNFGRTEKNWYLEELKQGQRVQYFIDDPKNILTGTICGIAGNGVPVAGKTYIVQPDVPHDKEVYDYSHIAVFEVMLNPID